MGISCMSDEYEQTMSGVIEQWLLKAIGDEYEATKLDLLGGRDAKTYVAKLLSAAETVVYSNQGEPQALVAYYCNDRETLTCFISMVIVSRAARGRGVALGLVSSVLASAAERGFKRCCLEVYSRNEPAIRLYRRLGFVATGGRAELTIMEREIK